ncbi:hypothetical protein BBJ28_00010358 [Nothophytophthora sp. Chile5]|nr:hypothetical protein BBJ28_00010358 [Nothophytophthora sp. Chile5]
MSFLEDADDEPTVLLDVLAFIDSEASGGCSVDLEEDSSDMVVPEDSGSPSPIEFLSLPLDQELSEVPDQLQWLDSSDLLALDLGTEDCSVLRTKQSKEQAVPNAETTRVRKRRVAADARRREKKRTERQDLRRHVADLQAQLDGLQRERRSVCAKRRREVAETCPMMLQEEEARERRFQAEQTNKELRKLVSKQLEMAEGFSESLKKQHSVSKHCAEAALATQLTKPLVNKAGPMTIPPSLMQLAENSAAICDLQRSMEQLYLDADRVFEPLGSATLESVSSQTLVRRFGDCEPRAARGRPYVQVTTTAPLNCGLAEASQLISRTVYAKSDQPETKSRYEFENPTEVGAESLGMKLAAVIKESVAAVDLQGVTFLQQFVEEDRIVYVWAHLKQTVGSCSGIRIREKGWLVASRAPRNPQVASLYLLEPETAEDDDAQTLEAALSFLAECEASTEWLLDVEGALDLPDVSNDGSISGSNGDMDEDLELPTLTEQPIETDGHYSAHQDATPETMDSIVTTPEDRWGQQQQLKSKDKGKGKKPKQPRKYSNRARDARREELVYLRQKVKDMQLHLDQLRDTQKPRTASAPFSSVAAPPSAATALKAKAAAKPSALRNAKLASTPSATFSSVAAPMASTASPSHLAAVWGDMAQRQAQERQKAERENVRLKLVLERQIKMAKSLEHILKKRHNDRPLLTSFRCILDITKALGGPSKRIRRVAPAPGPIAARDDRADFDMLLSGIEQSRQELDAVFEANGLGRMESAHRTAKIAHDATRGMVMEIYANKVMPFDMPTTGKAVWRHFAHSMDHMPHRTYYEKQPLHIEASDDTVVERYGLEMTDGHTQGDFHVKHIIRRYVEPDRIIVVWRTLTDTVEFSAELAPGIRFLEKGYIVIKPPATGQQDCTLMQTCYIIRPEIYGRNVPDQARKVGALTDFVLSSVSGSISASHQMIENVLLNGALKK